MKFKEWYQTRDHNYSTIHKELTYIGELLDKGVLTEESTLSDAKQLLEFVNNEEGNEEDNETDPKVTVTAGIEELEDNLEKKKNEIKALSEKEIRRIAQRIVTKTSSGVPLEKVLMDEQEFSHAKLEDSLKNLEKNVKTGSGMLGGIGSLASPILRAMGWLATKVGNLIWKIVKPFVDYSLRFLYSALVRDMGMEKNRAPFIKNLLMTIITQTMFTIIAGVVSIPLTGGGIGMALIGGFVLKGIRNLALQFIDPQFVEKGSFLDHHYIGGKDGFVFQT